jgi:hypothetical protein
MQAEAIHFTRVKARITMNFLIDSSLFIIDGY